MIMERISIPGGFISHRPTHSRHPKYRVDLYLRDPPRTKGNLPPKDMNIIFFSYFYISYQGISVNSCDSSMGIL